MDTQETVQTVAAAASVAEQVATAVAAVVQTPAAQAHADAPAPTDPVLARLQAFEARLAPLEAIVGQMAPMVGALVPALAPEAAAAADVAAAAPMVADRVGGLVGAIETMWNTLAAHFPTHVAGPSPVTVAKPRG